MIYSCLLPGPGGVPQVVDVGQPTPSAKMGAGFGKLLCTCKQMKLEMLSLWEGNKYHDLNLWKEGCGIFDTASTTFSLMITAEYPQRRGDEGISWYRGFMIGDPMVTSGVDGVG